MTKPLTNAQKRERKAKRKQRKASKAATVVSQLKPEEKTPGPPEVAPATPSPANLCDDCAYEFGECEGKPKFASDQDKTLTGADADRVIECPAFVNVAEMPTADQAEKEAAAEETIPEIVIVCSGDCGKTTEGMTLETKSGEFRQVDESGVPEWTCQDCLDKAAVESDQRSETDIQSQVIRTDLPERPNPKRFETEEDFGDCQSCVRPLKRTAFNRYQDAIRCVNPRCPLYRTVLKTVSTGVK